MIFLGNYFWNLETPVFIFYVFITEIYLMNIWRDNWRFSIWRCKRTLLLAPNLTIKNKNDVMPCFDEKFGSNGIQSSFTKNFTPLWLRTHDDRRAIFTYSADGSSSKFNSSPFFLQLTGSQCSTHYGFKRDSDANRISLFVDNDGWMNALTLSRVKLWPDNYDTTEHYTTQIERRRAGDTIGDTAV